MEEGLCSYYMVVFFVSLCYTRVMRKAFLLILLIIFLTVSFFSIVSFSTQLAKATEKVAYELPYPGILPDHPLYVIKIARDRVLEYTTRDPAKKAQLYLLLSDKRVAMALALIQKGKIKPAISTLSKGEKYFLQIPELVKTAKKQGSALSGDFILQLKLSNQKHREVGEMLLRQLPQGDLESLQQVLDLNKETEKKIKAL